MGDISTENTMRERAGESRAKLWLLLGANRLIVTGAIAAVFFALFVLLGTVIYPPFRSSVTGTDTIGTMFSTMLSALITGVTLVVTISQLVISQENGPLGDQHRRMSDAMDVRSFVSEVIGETVPSNPSALLRKLIDATEARANELREGVSGSDDETLEAEVEEFTDSLTGNSEVVKDQLEDAGFGTFDVLFAALNFNYSWKIQQVERISEKYGDDLDRGTKTALEELRTALSMFGPIREHIKTLYFQWALVDLSQMILYAAIPALLVAGGMLTFVTGSSFAGATLGVENILWVVGVAFTITLIPFFLFVSYVLRIATVAKRTLAIGPLVLRDSQG
ncbi:hypothetical protein [Halegenticoccus tardaugens]|uniref:hypothetical protein n=1 Tax=Halegenticoccus tardaugens TaxID=2071624 RepID=UPI0013E97D6E|nr:hypothetical protein [Halegenticoccus tardaugens]